MTEDPAQKRARDLARYHAKRNAGTWQRSIPATPEQLDRQQARQQRTILWRQVDRALHRLTAMPPDVFSEAKRRVDAGVR